MSQLVLNLKLKSVVIGGFLIGIDIDIGVQNGWRSKFLCHSREVTYYLHWHGGGLFTKVS